MHACSSSSVLSVNTAAQLRGKEQGSESEKTALSSSSSGSDQQLQSHVSPIVSKHSTYVSAMRVRIYICIPMTLLIFVDPTDTGECNSSAQL